MRTIDQIVADLPTERRAKVVARSNALVAEEMALRHLRKARHLTQENMAILLNIDQAGISKIENRSDMMLSTLRSYVEAMGGSLKLTAEFSDGSIEIATIGDVADRASGTKRRLKGPAAKATDRRNGSDEKANEA